MNTYEPVIGLEVHVQLATKSKIFCACSTKFGSEPNANTCPICMGLPGTLPVLNEQALRLAMKVGLALNTTIAKRIKFDRKNYFYPDLPKAYQISQYDMPVCAHGGLTIQPESSGGITKQIGITRAHLEEDAGKLLHEGVKDGSWVDYNRAGIPLLEIVSEPDIRSPEEAYDYLTRLKAVLLYLEVSDCNMEEGSLRCDANVSLRPKGESQFGTKVEIKNLNSFKAVQKALQYEIERQTEALEQGEKIAQETRLWNDMQGKTISMRSKEHAHDYRYFPEPDLVPFTVTEKEIEAVRRALPELPQARKERFVKNFGLSDYDASVLVNDKVLGEYFENCVKEGANAKLACNWIQTDLLGALNERCLSFDQNPITPKHLAGMLALIENNTISGKIGKDVLPLMIDEKKTADQIVKEKNLVQVTDTKLLEDIAERVIAANPNPVEQYKSGKTQAIGFLVGQIMKETKGKANPKIVNEILQKKLS
ncbi:MAG: Asp-tRNA(Asn)/Glu-tRNA(Gln) amidotransferase GatCAB subunit B [Candidatus Omnitrophica bacterium CG11_big_fil_rev_8_21_14_0_20_45_26]|uniref:Aspartyl/glutamyl-tRNA(Asn/Gln) amidotransferase subunit B n=1 Tax=Candidatus Abzuiibacterium crystallinum TaxID=1974748 RepID=A0A2H0LQU7_9BACT|nr:MAG: Asp-tRNA(Asn)/Glu-tRNA(Gln) amidotransferase GatCAB subunit B [Candidatus Omnitrophica bacterium CG11_big_fil_rev_8_21_14_0_20_45_26]PIW65075.1 MAG: Asp-tRNA(Asn)/Glu-tRNA(Gln) amidotransferase GatCAB subunit B [Candidatus Omnitrophica bacterium CG12_big_fil_rev_8_21_14_0_65_45_16]